MSFITNIQSVAKYESKILVRSWFFRIFTLLAVAFLGFFNFAMLLMEDSGGLWFEKSVASNIPYFSLLLLNTGQAVVAVFLSSEFLKRDKKLDTSEVFYVRPLSNAEYVVGKIWGNLRVFLLLNVLNVHVSAEIHAHIISAEQRSDGFGSPRSESRGKHRRVIGQVLMAEGEYNLLISLRFFQLCHDPAPRFFAHGARVFRTIGVDQQELNVFR